MSTSSEHFFLETDRTKLRPFLEKDAADLCELNADPEVLRYTGDVPFNNLEDSRNFIQNYNQFQDFRLGRFAVIEKKSGVFLGWCGVKFHREENFYDLGFRFKKEYWGKGFATETARECLDYAFTQIEVPKILGRAQKQNHASIRVLEKIGMSFIEEFDFEGVPGMIFSVSR